MNEIESLKIGLQSLVADVQNLSNTVRSASSSMLNTSASVMGAAQNASIGAQQAFTRMYPQALYAPQNTGFIGAPMGVPYGQMAPLNTDRKTSILSNLTQGTFNNEYNRPANWWRDIMALNGKQFVDTSAADAKKYASRNWEYRGKMAAWDAVGTAMYFVPGGLGLPLGLAFDNIVKPMIVEGDKRSYEYWNFLDRVGSRNVDARLTRNPQGGFTDADKKTIADQIQGAWKGTGFKKGQWDELFQLTEQAGYYKTYDKASVDSFREKAERMARDAKYMMQTLHTTTQETAKIMGDINKMGGTPGSTYQINLLNKAAAYTGLAPTQVHEFAMGRSETFRARGYGEKESYTASMNQLVDAINAFAPGAKPRPEQVLNDYDRIVQIGETGTSTASLMASIMTPSGNGGLAVDVDKFNRLMSGGADAADLVREGAANFRNYTPQQAMLMQSGAYKHLIEDQLKKQGYTPHASSKIMAGMSLQAELYSFDPKQSGEWLKDGGTIPEYALAHLAQKFGMRNLQDVKNLINFMDKDSDIVTPARTPVGDDYVGQLRGYRGKDVDHVWKSHKEREKGSYGIADVESSDYVAFIKTVKKAQPLLSRGGSDAFNLSEYERKNKYALDNGDYTKIKSKDQDKIMDKWGDADPETKRTMYVNEIMRSAPDYNKLALMRQLASQEGIDISTAPRKYTVSDDPVGQTAKSILKSINIDTKNARPEQIAKWSEAAAKEAAMTLESWRRYGKLDKDTEEAIQRNYENAALATGFKGKKAKEVASYFNEKIDVRYLAGKDALMWRGAKGWATDSESNVMTNASLKIVSDLSGAAAKLADSDAGALETMSAFTGYVEQNTAVLKGIESNLTKIANKLS